MLADFDLNIKLYSRQWVVKFTFLMSGNKSKYVRGRDSERAQETGIRRTETNLLRNKVYKIVETWEFDWRENLKGNKSLKNTCEIISHSGYL